MRRYFIQYLINGMVVEHVIPFMFLKDALESAYWHTQYFGADLIQIYHGSNLVAEIGRTEA